MTHIDGKASKDAIGDITKAPLDLVPASLPLAAARALAFGAKKYARHNWRKGMAWSEAYSALQRHLLAWNEGEERDADSGLSHLDHAAACLAFLVEYAARPAYERLDDRWTSGPLGGAE